MFIYVNADRTLCGPYQQDDVDRNGNAAWFISLPHFFYFLILNFVAVPPG